VGCGSARCGTAWHGKVRIINNEYRIRLGSAWRGSVRFGKARFNK